MAKNVNQEPVQSVNIFTKKVIGRLGWRSLRDGRLAEVFRVLYEDTINAAQQPNGYKQAFLLAKSLRIDGERVTIKDVLDMDALDAQELLHILFQGMKQ